MDVQKSNFEISCWIKTNTVLLGVNRGAPKGGRMVHLLNFRGAPQGVPRGARQRVPQGPPQRVHRCTPPGPP